MTGTAARRDNLASLEISALTLLPFALLALLGQMIAFTNPVPLSQHYFWPSTALLAVAIVGFCFPFTWRSSSVTLVFLVSYVGSVGLLLIAEGGKASGSGTLFLLPVIAAALFLGSRETLIATLAALAMLLAVGLSIHSPDDDLVRRLILWSAVCALVVVPIRTLRSRLQRSLHEARRLLHEARTLDVAARELSSLATESEVVAAAARLAAEVVSTPGAVQWQGAYLRHEGRGEVVVESSFPAGATGSSPMLPDATLRSLFTGVPDEAQGGAGSGPGDRAPAPRAAWVPVAPDGVPHGFLGIASRSAVTPEVCGQLAAIAQLVELSLSSLFAHKRIEDQAAAEERRRIARDLHDGLAHELTFIASKTRAMAREHPDAGELARSADRALDEARRAITVLSADHRQRIAESISQTAEDLSRRHDVAIRLDVADTVDVAGDLGEHLLRITREAISNAASHGRPKTITVSLWRDHTTHLVVEDDGSGFDLSEPSRGFGLVSMKERAAHLGGELDIRSAPDRGTRVEVLIP